MIPLDKDNERESLIEQIKELEWSYRKLEKSYHKLQMKYQDRQWIIRKQSKRIKQMQDKKDHYCNEPKIVRQRKGKLK